MATFVPSGNRNEVPGAATSTPTPATHTFLPPKPEPHSEISTYGQQRKDLFLSISPSVISSTTKNSTGTKSAATALGNVYSEAFREAFFKRMQRFGDIEVLEEADDDSRAIVPIPSPDESSLSQEPTSCSRKRQRESQRGCELVRVTDMGFEDQMNFRENIRLTRMIYDSLRLFCSFDELKSGSVVAGSRVQPNVRAAGLMRDRGLWMNREKRIVGSIPGVLVGDLFFYRMELCVVGLHGQNQAGIDYLGATLSPNGEPIATSVVVSGGYEDDEDEGDVIIYTGHGGQDKLSRMCNHQKLEGGNLAMERSMHYGIEVRVIRGMNYVKNASQKVYIYDGLYKIDDAWLDVGKSGFGVYKFKLVRIQGQPDMGSTILKYAESLRAKPLEVRPKGYLSLDISMKKENVPVLLYNDVDNDSDPLLYDYLKGTVYPPMVFQQLSDRSGCNCVDSCQDGCLCAMKNGGEFAYDQNGMLLRGKPVIFECGKFCKCPPTCRNRVTQHGLRNRFEIFRSKETGWGVRSLDLIQAGSFICEYAGVVLTREQAAIFEMNGDSLIYPNQFTARWTEWGDLSKVFPDYARPHYPSVPPIDFALDVSRMRNVACYMSHSSSPNVMVQLVLYDHNSLMFPHLMVFAMENIPPLRELSLDYGVADECSGKLAIAN